MRTDSDAQTHHAARFVDAPPQRVYEALTRAGELVQWLPPHGATGRIDEFEPRPGGRIRITLTFESATGKSSEHSDVVEGHFVELVPAQRVVQAFSFDAPDPEFAGVMRMTWQLAPMRSGTQVQVTATDVPPGIRREDHEPAMASSLEKLAAFVEG